MALSMPGNAFVEEFKESKFRLSSRYCNQFQVRDFDVKEQEEGQAKFYA